MIEEFNKLLYKNDYDREKWVAHGMIHSGIPTPEKNQHPLFHWKMIIIQEKTQLIHILLS